MTVNTLTRLNISPAYNTEPSNPCVWYPFHEGTGTSLVDALGNGPNITVSGTTASIWGTIGAISPNGTDVKGNGQNAYVDSLCSLSDLRTNSKMLLVGYELAIPSVASAVASVLQWGRFDSINGGWYVGMNGSDQPTFNVRYAGEATDTSTTFGKNIADSFSTAKRLMFAIIFSNSNTMEITYFNEDLTTGLATLDVTGKTLPSASTDGLTLFARRTGGASYDRWLGLASQNVNNLFIYKHPTIDLSFAQEAYSDFQTSRRELPRSLRGF